MAGMKTIGIDLWAGQARGEHENRQTCISTSPRIVQPKSMRELRPEGGEYGERFWSLKK